jgi:hypothetical protein
MKYKFPLYCPLHFPLLREASSRNLVWALSGCLVPAQQRHPLLMTTTTIVPKRNYVPGWIHIHTQSSTETLPFLNRPPPNTRVTTLPPFLTCSGHPSMCWPHARCSLTCMIIRAWDTRYSIARLRKASYIAL